MSFWQLFALVLTGAVALASILGVFFAIYAKQNGRITREFIAEQNKELREFTAEQNKGLREFTAEQNKGLREFTTEQNKVLAQIAIEGFERIGLKLESLHKI